MAKRCDLVIYAFTKILLKQMEKGALTSLFDTFSFLSAREKDVLVMIYCDHLPMKCVAFRLKISKRWADKMHCEIINKIAPCVFSFILSGLSRAL